MDDRGPPADDVAAQLAQLQAGYIERLSGEFEVLGTLAAGLTGSSTFHDDLGTLHARLHKLAGSGGTFGLPHLSAAARAVEQRVKQCIEESGQTEMDVTGLVAEINALAATVVPEATPDEPSIRAPAVLPEVSSRVIWLVEDDPFLGQELAHQLESFNYAVRFFDSPEQVDRALHDASPPDMLIMDVMFVMAGNGAASGLPAELQLRNLKCPLLFVSAHDDFDSRVRAAKLGAEGYFLKPLDIPRVIGRIAQVFERHQAPQEHVLIVDDDRDLAEHYRLVLTGAGMCATVLDDPRDIVNQVSALHPELVLMDLHMPEYSGPDLAAVIRQHESWDSLPIVYLSAETDLALQIDAMSRGADDFLTKPVSDAQLIAAVRARIERARQLDAQIVKDSLTGLLKHASIKEALAIEVARAQRTGKPLTVAMLDIDHFKSVNDNYGHATGDVVIASVAMLLRQRMRHTDILGRYGGEEFVVVLPDCNESDGQMLLDDIRRRFQDVHFTHGDAVFRCSLSAGVSATTRWHDNDGSDLLAAADAGLYAAKHAGRNRVCLAPAEQSDEGSLE